MKVYEVEEQWDVPGLEQALEVEFGLTLPVKKWLDEDEQLHDDLLTQVMDDEAVQTMLEVFPAEIKDVEEI